jgi:HSP20 family protein
MSDTAIEKRETDMTEPESTYGGRGYAPTVDIIEEEDELLLLADVPGATAEDIDIDFERGLLTLHARVKPRQPQDTNYLLREYGVGDFYRSFRIGEGIDAGKINAEIANGVLKLHLPKAEAIKPRKVQVKTTE